VIELELNETDVKPVIVGAISDVSGNIQISITQSAEFYDNSLPTSLSNADVSISDDKGVTVSLAENTNGIYQTNELDGQLGESYTLEVIIEGSTYQATAMIPQTKISIDSIAFEFEEESIFRKEGFFPIVYYNDPVDEVNYYRFIAKVNGQAFDFTWEDDEEDPDLATAILLSSDKFSNGGLQDFDFNYHLKSGDIFTVEMQHLDRSTFDYLRTLSDVGSGAGVAPADPISNFGTDALGYFGAFSSTTLTATVP